MVHYEIPKPPITGFLARARESVRLASAFMKGDKATIDDITAQTVFSPLQPLQPYTPNIVGRLWDYAPGINIQFQPRGYGSGRVPFTNLRAFSRNCEILRLVIETVKDQICGFDWQIVPKEDSTVSPDDPRIAQLTAFFKMPDRVHTFEQWLRMILEEFMVTDSVSIYRPKDRVGRPYAFEVIDGATIKPLIDADGRRPLVPDPAYQQVFKGAPRVDYTIDELLYMPRNLLSYDPLYGYSMTEQTLVTIQTSIQRAQYQLKYFTEGSLPDAYAEMPEGLTADSIRAFEDRFNDILSGNAGERRKVPFLPNGTKISALKAAPLKDEFDEWIARIICFSFGLAPTAFIRQMNRATADNDKERAQEEGQAPKMQYIKTLIDTLIGDFGPEYSANFEYTWRESANQDPKEQADVETEYVKNGIKTINEARSALGLDPMEGGDTLMALTPTGFVPLDSFEQNQQMQQANMEANAKAKADAVANAPNAENEDQTDEKTGETEQPKPEPGTKMAYGRLGKAVRHPPIPFDVRQPTGHKHH